MKDAALRRALKTNMYNTDGSYRGFNPTITPALVEKQDISIYSKANGDGLLIVHFPVPKEALYAAYDQETKTLFVDSDTVRFPGELSAEMKRDYLTYLYPLVDRKSTRLNSS